MSVFKDRGYIVKLLPAVTEYERKLQAGLVTKCIAPSVSRFQVREDGVEASLRGCVIIALPVIVIFNLV